MGEDRVERVVRYEGHPAMASAAVQFLEKEGLEVSWERPEEQRGGVVQEVVIPLLVAGGAEVMREAVPAVKELLRRMFKDNAPRVDLEGDDGENGSDQGR